MKTIILLILCFVSLEAASACAMGEAKGKIVFSLAAQNRSAVLKTVDVGHANLQYVIAKARADRMVDESVYYVRVYRRSEGRVFKFYLAGKEAAKPVDLEKFIIREHDEVYFGYAIP